MSAPQPGRQSPDPAHQTDQQKGAPAHPNQQGGDTQTKEKSDAHKLGLASNPVHVLEKHAQDTTSKSVTPPN
ncbi:hypothetical protein EJ07DRAFT_96150 [Lizonia empirigonia]|nr:hypothetical protein EJ07DRAFT_96150 [Lizonia empirigonia]